MFNEADTNDDGVIDGDELAHALGEDDLGCNSVPGQWPKGGTLKF